MEPGRPATSARYAVWLAAALIVLGILAAFHNSFGGAWVFDDFPSIRDNPTLRHLWPPGSALSPPPGGTTVSGRPILNLSFAINYALGGADVRGYHALNLAIHVFAALTLFGVIRRTLGRTAPPGRARLIAFAVALLWGVHPLQTESVTYIVQRAESLMGLFYLLTLYAFIRGAEAQERPGQRAARGWFALAVVFCLLGAGTKEVIVSAPLICLFYDRTFLAGTLRGAWHRRRTAYLGLAASWLVLGWLVMANHDRGGTAGLDVGLQAFWTYWPTQGPAILRYLRLAVWPAHQLIDYGFEFRWVRQPLSGVPADLAVLGLLVLAALACRRRSALGFLGIWFFAILAPTSLIPGLRQTVVEHRMYLALAPVLLLLVLALEYASVRIAGRGRAAALLTLGAIVAAAAAGITLSVRRNEIYRSDQAVWADVVAKEPDSESGLNNLGNDLLAAGRVEEAMDCFQKAVRAEPAYLRGYINYGHCLEILGRNAEALSQYRTALRFRPDYPEGHANAGRALLRLGRTDEAVSEFERAEALKPTDAETHNNFGAALLALGRLAEAQEQLTHATMLNPDNADALRNLGLALRMNGQPAEAVLPLERSLRLRPDDSVAHFNLGLALQATGRMEQAETEFREVVRLLPDFAEGHNNLGSALALLGRIPEAQAQFAEAVKLRPDFAEAHHNLGKALAQSGRLPEAIAQFREALRLKPNFAAAQEDLDEALGVTPAGK